ncbi:MAG: SAM-dependent methyltransferase [Gammaproteobacteria bacterium]|jgi:SAM-dependent methyltransferase|nr:SAM-dependent methyltransferase [Gammaproteobacteria bacterium]
MNKHQQKWNKRYAASELVWSVQPNVLFASEVANLTPGKALDVACGEGRNAIWLADKGWEVTAIDYADAAVAKGVSMADRRGVFVNWVVADIADVEKSQYDLVAVLYFHTGQNERQEWLPTVVNCVAPKGSFIYIGHDPSNICYGVGGPRDPALLPSVEEITNCLKGFKIEDARVVERRTNKETGHDNATTGLAFDTFVSAIREL